MIGFTIRFLMEQSLENRSNNLISFYVNDSYYHTKNSQDESVIYSKTTRRDLILGQNYYRGFNRHPEETSFNDTLSIYIYQTSILDNNQWRNIIDKDLYLARYDLSFEDISKLENQLYFPPDERMGNMKIVYKK